MLLETLFGITVLFSLQSSGSIQWPAETYGIPKPISGCPQAVGFRWETGWMLQRDEWHYQNIGSQSNNTRSLEFHIDGKVDRFTVKRSFCMKEDTSKDFSYKRPTWPRGKYCIYKGIYRCPEGLTFGWVFWFDSYDNDKSDGFLPDGDYSKYTEIHFCCRTDGEKDDPILLPSNSPFFLLAYESAKCQMVKWAVASLEWIYYYTHNKEDDQRNGSYPYNAGKMHPTIYYCYYQGYNETLTAVNGTFQSSNCPLNYSDGQYCFWRIAVTTAQQLYLIFSSFGLENDNNTDALYVLYDGENAKEEALEVFNGGHPPPKGGICISSNRIFVVFKSDNAGSLHSFSASYYGVNNSESCVIAASQPSKESGKKEEQKQPHRKGLNVVAVVVPVVSAILLAALAVAGICYIRKRRKRVEGPDDEIYLRLSSEPTASDESTNL